MSDWTEARIDRLKELWSAGHSCSDIAEFLGGCTRNGVIGKIHRLGMSGQVRPSTVSRQRRTEARLPYVRIERAPKPPRPISVTPPRRPLLAEPPSLGLTIFQLRDATEFTPGTCKWPHGDQPPYLFCGNPTTEKSRYCGFHRQASVDSGTPSERRATSA